MDRMFFVSLIAAAAFAGSAPSQHPDPEPPHDGCSYSVLHNGPTWDSSSMHVSREIIANAWARDGAYGGGGTSLAMGFRSGGAAVAVASGTYWFKLSHHAVAGCTPVTFDSEASLKADVSTRIYGDRDDYALATGFQSIEGNALKPASVAVAATNAGSLVAQSTLAVSFGTIGFTVTIPGVSITSDTVDEDRNSASTSGSMKIEAERITVHCWTKIKVVTNGPFGGWACASDNHTEMSASTTSTCPVHAETGAFAHYASEG